MKYLRSRYFIPGIHIVIWSLLLSIPVIIFSNRTFEGLSHSFFFVTSLYHIAIFYANAYFLYPRLLTKKWWWLYILCIAAILKLSYHIKLFFLQLNPAFIPDDVNRRVIFFGLVPFIAASIIFRLISDRLHFEKLQKEAAAERLSAELKFLRSQVSPHFLFNTMTNMVALARQQSVLLEPSLIKLSDLLRYMLYDSEEGKIPLHNEIEQLKNYIDLQQLRFGDDVNITIKAYNEDNDCLIEPLLLIPFIENAFKHGVGMLKDPYINIALSVRQKMLHFTVTNKYNPSNTSKDKSSGIGLANVKNRLALLYPGKYELTITDDDETFSVRLNLDLS